MASPRLQNVMAGFSIEEVRRLVELWEEIQEIANGPDPERSARGFLERRYCVDRLRRLSTDLEAAERRVRTILTLTRSHAAAGSAARGALRQFPQASPSSFMRHAASNRRGPNPPGSNGATKIPSGLGRHSLLSFPLRRTAEARGNYHRRPLPGRTHRAAPPHCAGRSASQRQLVGLSVGTTGKLTIPEIGDVEAHILAHTRDGYRLKFAPTAEQRAQLIEKLHTARAVPGSDRADIVRMIRELARALTH